MKVVEEDTDRRAEVHLFAEGNINALSEYDEHIDPVDNAICCFVPVEIGQKVKIGGRFNGTSQSVHCDVLVDGVCRKSVSYHNKSAIKGKAKKFDTDKVLFNTKEGILDAEIIVAPISSDLALDENGFSSLGCVETRINVLRRTGDEHIISNIPFYFNCVDEGHNDEKITSYKGIAPDLLMTFDRDCASLDTAKANRERKKMTNSRPGTEAWAIFRFYYRSLAAIEAKELDQTYNSAIKNKKSPRTLQIEPLPLLNAVPKSESTLDAEEVRSSRSSLAPSTIVPETPVQTDYDDNVKALQSTPLEQPTSGSSQRSPSPDNQGPTLKDSEQAKQTFEESPSLPITSLPRPMVPPATSAVHERDASTEPTKPTQEQAAESLEDANDTNNEALKSNIKKSIESSGSHEFAASSDSIPTTMSSTLKRSHELTPPASPTSKRTKHLETSYPSHSPSPASSLVAQKLAEARRRRDAAKKKRKSYSIEQNQINEKLVPYEQKMQENLDRILREAEEEERGANEDEERLRESKELLEKFSCEDK